jgi:hypothetical protein
MPENFDDANFFFAQCQLSKDCRQTMARDSKVAGDEMGSRGKKKMNLRFSGSMCASKRVHG